MLHERTSGANKINLTILVVDFNWVVSSYPEVSDMLVERTALPLVSCSEIQNLHGDALHNLLLVMPRGGSLMGTCWISNQDIGAGKQKCHGKRRYRVYCV